MDRGIDPAGIDQEIDHRAMGKGRVLPCTCGRHACFAHPWRRPPTGTRVCRSAALNCSPPGGKAGSEARRVHARFRADRAGGRQGRVRQRIRIRSRRMRRTGSRSEPGHPELSRCSCDSGAPAEPHLAVPETPAPLADALAGWRLPYAGIGAMLAGGRGLGILCDQEVGRGAGGREARWRNKAGGRQTAGAHPALAPPDAVARLSAQRWYAGAGAPRAPPAPRPPP